VKDLEKRSNHDTKSFEQLAERKDAEKKYAADTQKAMDRLGEAMGSLTAKDPTNIGIITDEISKLRVTRER
jgi:hypothetical protein